MFYLPGAILLNDEGEEAVVGLIGAGQFFGAGLVDFRERNQSRRRKLRR
jgi:hypothetical protein